MTADFIPDSFVAALDPADTDIAELSDDEVFTGKVAVEPSGLGTSYADDMRKITITLSWETSGRPQERSMTTMVSKNGLQNYIY